MAYYRTQSISLPDDLRDELDDAADMLDLNRSQALRAAARLWLDTNRNLIAGARLRRELTRKRPRKAS